MVKTQKIKYILLQAAIVALTATYCIFPDALYILAALTIQIGLYSAIAAQKPYALSLFSVPLSYAVAFTLVGDWRVAVLSVLFWPVGTLVAVCIRKGVTRAKTVLLTSVLFGVCLVSYAVMILWMLDIRSIDEFSEKLISGMKFLAQMSANSLPEASLVKGLTRDVYEKLVYDFLRISFIGTIVFACNTVAFVSTAIAKRIVIKTKGNTMLNNDPKWLYVLSKSSALVFIVCYLCVLVGGETLTLPEQIAFNTVVIATLGGVLIMAFRAIKGKNGFAGIPVLIIYAIVLFALGLQALLILLSITGLVAAFRYKNMEDKDICKK